MPGCVPEDICALVLGPGGRQPTQQLKDAHCAGCGKPCSPAASFSAEPGVSDSRGHRLLLEPRPLGQQTGMPGAAD